MRTAALLCAGAALVLTACEPPPEEEEVAVIDRGEFEKRDDTEFVTAIDETSDAPFGIEARAVRIGVLGSAHGACRTRGVISDLDPDVGYYLPVHVAPDARADQSDQLTEGTVVTICETEGAFYGVVYSGSGMTDADCGVDEPVSSERRYDGWCRSGWIDTDYFEARGR